MDHEVNIFKNARGTSCLNVVKITSVLKAIKNGKWKDIVEPIRELKENKAPKNDVDEAKKLLPAVAWSGVFTESRADDNLAVYNKLMVVDIDNITKTRLKRLKKELVNNPMVYAYFNGPTKGIKVLIFVSAGPEWHNTHTFWQIETLFDEMYGIEIDPTGKNLSRLCFVSYDPDLYINPEPMELQIEEQEDPDAGFRRVSNYDYSNCAPETDSTVIMETCIKMVNASATGTYHKGNRNKYVFSLSCLMCEFGVNPELSLTLIASRYQSLKYKEIRTTVESAFKRCYKNFGTKTVNRRKNNNQQDLL
ncbi:MAG: BT4734/BF3469 family protein [Candidatus Hodarchaeales archaeon]